MWLQAAGALSGTGINLTGVADSVAGYTMGHYRSMDLRAKCDARSERGRGRRQVPVVQHAHRRGPQDAGSEAGGKHVLRPGRLHGLHAGAAPTGDLPGSCKAQDLSAQEKALEYLFFNLSACVHDETRPPPNLILPSK